MNFHCVENSQAHVRFSIQINPHDHQKMLLYEDLHFF